MCRETKFQKPISTFINVNIAEMSTWPFVMIELSFVFDTYDQMGSTFIRKAY